MLRILPMASTFFLSPLRLPQVPRKRVSFSSLNPSRKFYALHYCTPFFQSYSYRTRTPDFIRGPGDTFGNGAPVRTLDNVVIEEDPLKWVKTDKRRLMHVVYRVGDLDRTIRFYTECLFMKVLRRNTVRGEGCKNAFLGFGSEDSHFVIELTCNESVYEYNIGKGFGHIGLAVDDVAKTTDFINIKCRKEVTISEPFDAGNGIIAFLEDPDGYKFQLIQRGTTPEPLCRVMLRVGDLDRSIKFYEKALGMELLRKRDNPEDKCTVAFMGYGPEDKKTVMELTYHYGVTKYDKGNGYTQIAIGTSDVYRTAEAIRLCGGEIVREPGPLPRMHTKITACVDPDGWKTVFVDNIDFTRELQYYGSP